MTSRFRVRILCEDRKSERFLRRLCERFGVNPIDVNVAPKGTGSASAWVLQQYAPLVGRRRSNNFQRNLGLLVHIDGDNLGLQRRKEELDARLHSAKPHPMPVRTAGEPVAIFVPTWCIETWLLHLAGIAQPPESTRLKHAPCPEFCSALEELERNETEAIRAAAAAWPGAVLPSVRDSQTEARRIGIVTPAA